MNRPPRPERPTPGRGAKRLAGSRRAPPDAAEIERIASETAMNDSLLRKGDIVATHRGFFVFRGLGPDGYTFEFSPVPGPVSAGKIDR